MESLTVSLNKKENLDYDTELEFGLQNHDSNDETWFVSIPLNNNKNGGEGQELQYKFLLHLLQRIY